MTGAELRIIRKRLGLSTRLMGKALGWTGKPNTVSTGIRQFESDKGRKIPRETEIKIIEIFSGTGD